MDACPLIITAHHHPPPLPITTTTIPFHSVTTCHPSPPSIIPTIQVQIKKDGWAQIKGINRSVLRHLYGRKISDPAKRQSCHLAYQPTSLTLPCFAILNSRDIGRVSLNYNMRSITDQHQTMPPGPKPAGTPRRVSSSLSKVSTPPTTTNAFAATRANKSSKLSKIVHIKLSKDRLLRFPHEHQIRKASQPKASPLSTSTVVTPDESTRSSAAQVEADSTPTLSEEQQDSTSPTKDIKSETVAPPKAGVKRELGAGVEADDQDTPKTNAKKRPKP